MTDRQLTKAVARKLGWKKITTTSFYGGVNVLVGYRPGRRDGKYDYDAVPDYANDAKAVCRAFLNWKG